MTDINGYLYAGQTRVGTLTNPLCVTYSATTPSEFIHQSKPDTIIKEVVVIKEVPVEKIVVKEILKYNIKGDGFLFKAWYWIGSKAGWINGC